MRPTRQDARKVASKLFDRLKAGELAKIGIDEIRVAILASDIGVLEAHEMSDFEGLVTHEIVSLV